MGQIPLINDNRLTEYFGHEFLLPAQRRKYIDNLRS